MQKSLTKHYQARFGSIQKEWRPRGIYSQNFKTVAMYKNQSIIINIERIKENTHMIISIDTEKPFEKFNNFSW